MPPNAVTRPQWGTQTHTNYINVHAHFHEIHKSSADAYWINFHGYSIISDNRFDDLKQYRHEPNLVIKYAYILTVSTIWSQIYSSDVQITLEFYGHFLCLQVFYSI